MVVIDVSVSGILVSVLLSVGDEVVVDGLGGEVALELNRLHLLVTVDEEGWGAFDLLALGVLANDLSAGREGNIDVTELDLLVLDGLDGSQLLPLDGEFLASSACGVDIGNDPDVLNITDDHLLEGLVSDLVRSVPEAVVASVAVVVRNVLAVLGEVLLVHLAGSEAAIFVVGAVSVETVVVAVAIASAVASCGVSVAAAVATVVAVIVATVARAVAVVVAISVATIASCGVSVAAFAAVATVRLCGARPGRACEGSDQGKSTDI